MRQWSYVLLFWNTEDKGADVGEESKDGGDEGCGRGVEAVLDVANERKRPWSPEDVVDRQFAEVELAVPERSGESTKPLRQNENRIEVGFGFVPEVGGGFVVFENMGESLVGESVEWRPGRRGEG